MAQAAPHIGSGRELGSEGSETLGAGQSFHGFEDLGPGDSHAVSYTNISVREMSEPHTCRAAGTQLCNSQHRFLGQPPGRLQPSCLAWQHQKVMCREVKWQRLSARWLEWDPKSSRKAYVRSSPRGFLILPQK